MNIQKFTSLLFRANAMINWILSVPTIVDPQRIAGLFGVTLLDLPFLVRLWSGFVFMFGCMFWEAASDVSRKSALLKYNWIEKTITATSVTLGCLQGDAPWRLGVLIFLTNWLWIPVLLYCQTRLSETAQPA